jgi:LAO/AO transport system kinase
MSGATSACDPPSSRAALVEALLAGHPRALARAITLVEDDRPGSDDVLAALRGHLGHAHIVGVTGPPGAGKSTLIGALIGALRRRGRTVGVLAVDPSSPISGGAILGDRVRMSAHTSDPGVFVRSIASRGHLGGLFRTAWGVIQVMDAYGPDFIVLETVGSGQSEVEVADFAHTRLVLCAPDAGDDVQAIKAGILEIADVLVVNKSDRPFAERTVRELESMLALRGADARAAKVVATTATTGQGVAGLVDLLEFEAARADPATRATAQRAGLRRVLAGAAADALRERLVAGRTPALEAICDSLSRCEIGLEQAAHRVLDAVSTGPRRDTTEVGDGCVGDQGAGGRNLQVLA